MKSIGIIQIIAISLVSLLTSISNAVIAGPGAPTLIGFQQPYEINVCEDDWPTLELNINAIPGLNYRWDASTDPAVLAALEFNTGNTRVRIADADALPKNVAIFLVVQAVDATGCESFPTVIRLFLVPKLNVIAMPLDTACVGRPFPISPKNLIASIEQNRVDSLSWNFGGNADVVGGESSDLDDFIIAFNSAGMHSITMDVLDTRGCRTQISYDFTVFTAPPLPEILPCTYMGTDSIFFEWSIDNTFTNTMNIDLLPTGATIVETPTSLLVTGIAGGPTQSTTVITVSAEGTSPMPCNITSQTAICRSCIPVNFIYDGIPQNSFCAGDDGLLPVPLTVDVVTDAFMVTDPVEGNWEPGPGVEFVGGQAFFNPAGLPPGEYGVVYNYIHPLDNCPHPGGVGFTIFEAARPNASLSTNSVVTDTEICSDETVIIHFDRYEDIPRPNIFSDDVSGQVTISRASASSVRVSFGNIESDYQIFVEYSLPGCEPRTDIINVSVKLKPEVVVTCGPQQTDAVEVNWNALDGVTTYEILLDGVSQGPVSGLTTTIPGLAVDVDYVVTVIPQTLGCAETGSITCSTGGCVDPIIDLSSLADPRCYLDGSGPINLDVSIVSALTGDPIDYNWDTPLVDVDNNFQPNPAQELYTFDIAYNDGSCTGVIQAVDFTVIYNPEPILAFSTQDTICILDGTADLIAMATVFDPLNTVTYEGIFPVGVNPTVTGDGQWLMQFDGPGSYTVGVRAIYQGCEGEAFREIVVESAAPLDVQCGPQQNNAVEVTWPMVDGVTDFEILLDGTPYDITTGTSGIILGLDPEESYEVTVIPLNGSCTLEGTVMCTTGSCDPAAVDLSALTDNFCYVEGSGPINLDVNITSTNGNPSTYVWDSPLIDMDNNFVPDPAQELYTFDIIYTEGNCIETIADVSFTVITVPELDLSFSTPDSICILDGSVDFIAEAMVADPSALVIEGIFPAGVTETETLTGQWILNFDLPGTYEIGARATYQGCQSIEFFRTIFVDQDLGAPVVTATPGVGNVELTWEPPTYCVSSWEILVEGASIGTTSSLMFTVPLEEVRDYDITVVALSNGCVCGDEMTLITESPLPCPDIDIMTLPIDTCFNPTLAPFDMPVTVTESPLLPAGSGTWSGQLIDVNGQVDVSQTNFGDVFQLEYSYTQGSCTTVVTELISLSEPPNIINLESMPPPCSDDSLGTVIVLVEGGTPDYLYSVNGSLPQADNVIPGVELGLAMVEVTDARGCAVQELVDVMDNLLPNLDVSGPEVVLENNDADFTISTNILMTDITNISWFLDGELQDEGVELTTFSLLDVEQSGTIEVVVEYGMECTLFASTDFIVNEVQSIYIPNIVDYSGVSSTANAEWKAFIDGDQAFILSVQVYDRWGNKIRDFENVNRDFFTEFLLWDGFFGSVPAEQGVYSYVIETEILGNTKVERGSITILR